MLSDHMQPAGRAAGCSREASGCKQDLLNACAMPPVGSEAGAPGTGMTNRPLSWLTGPAVSVPAVTQLASAAPCHAR